MAPQTATVDERDLLFSPLFHPYLLREKFSYISAPKFTLLLRIGLERESLFFT